mgnify:CR=1 FL=1
MKLLLIISGSIDAEKCFDGIVCIHIGYKV